jgi:thiol-disulfide isomerase/thioredoxin
MSERHRSSRTLVGALLGLLTLLALAGCSAESGVSGVDVASGPSCLAGNGSPAGSSPTGTAPTGGPAGIGPAVPDVVLGCFDTNGRASLVELRAPAVVNLWGSWCAPCRAELPAFQRLADATAGRLRVIGVVMRDRRDSAQAFIDEAGLTFPMLEDRTQRLVVAVGQARERPLAGFPATLFLTADGHIAHIYNGPVLTDAALFELTERHLGVVVS